MKRENITHRGGWEEAPSRNGDKARCWLTVPSGSDHHGRVFPHRALYDRRPAKWPDYFWRRHLGSILMRVVRAPRGFKGNALMT